MDFFPLPDMLSSDMSDEINLRFLFNLEVDKRKTIEFCMSLGLIGKKYKCPKCDDGMKLVQRIDLYDGFEWMCRKYGESAHRIRRSIRKGSWFSESNLSVCDVLLLTYMWIMKFSNVVIKRELKVSNRTIVEWKSFCREVCVELCGLNNEMIGGENETVEINESKFAKQKYSKGKFMKGEWVYGGVQRGSNKCFFSVVQQRNKTELLDIIKKYILPGTTIVSPCWKTHDCLSDERFIHLKDDHSLNFKDPEAYSHTIIEGSWSTIKRSLGGSRQASGEFNSYLYEYMWRRSCNQDKGKEISSFFKGIAQIYTALEEDKLPQTEKCPSTSKD